MCCKPASYVNLIALRVSWSRQGCRKFENRVLLSYLIHPLSCVLIWNRVTSDNKNIESLEATQRQFVRYIMEFDKTSPTEANTSILGLLSVSSHIDKHRLMFFGRLCSSDVDLLHKEIFTNSVAEYLLGFSNICHITKSLLNTLSKYNLNEFLQNYISSRYFPQKISGTI